MNGYCTGEPTEEVIYLNEQRRLSETVPEPDVILSFFEEVSLANYLGEQPMPR